MIQFQDDSLNRCEILAKYLISHKTTVRKTAWRYGISKSTVHKDITQKLKKCNLPLYQQVKEILDLNKAERHLRGGEATRQKFLSVKEPKEKNKRK